MITFISLQEQSERDSERKDSSRWYTVWKTGKIGWRELRVENTMICLCITPINTLLRKKREKKLKGLSIAIREEKGTKYTPSELSYPCKTSIQRKGKNGVNSNIRQTFATPDELKIPKKRKKISLFSFLFFLTHNADSENISSSLPLPPSSGNERNANGRERMAERNVLGPRCRSLPSSSSPILGLS